MAMSFIRMIGWLACFWKNWPQQLGRLNWLQSCRAVEITWVAGLAVVAWGELIKWPQPCYPRGLGVGRHGWPRVINQRLPL